MKTLTLLSIMLALPLAAQTPDVKPDGSAIAAKIQTPLTPEEHDSYVLMVLQDLQFKVTLLDKLRNHQAGNEDIENSNKAYAERQNALKQLIAKHSACEGGDWNIAKKEWACPPAAPPPAK